MSDEPRPDRKDREPHDEIRDALRAGQPVFVRTTAGAVIGLQPLLSDSSATIMTIAARLPDSDLTVPGGEVTYPARQFVVATNLRALGPSADNEEHRWARIDEITMAGDGNILIPDVSRFHVPIITRVAEVQVGFGCELARECQNQMRAHRSVEEHDWRALITAPMEVLLDADGRLFAVSETASGELMVMDISASEHTHHLVVFAPATVQLHAWELVVNTPTSSFRSAPIVAIADTADVDHPLVVEYNARESQVLSRYVRERRMHPPTDGPVLGRHVGPS